RPPLELGVQDTGVPVPQEVQQPADALPPAVDLRAAVQPELVRRADPRQVAPEPHGRALRPGVAHLPQELDDSRAPPAPTPLPDGDPAGPRDRVVVRVQQPQLPPGPTGPLVYPEHSAVIDLADDRPEFAEDSSPAGGSQKPHEVAHPTASGTELVIGLTAAGRPGTASGRPARLRPPLKVVSDPTSRPLSTSFKRS